jgi:hypothetical protein
MQRRQEARITHPLATEERLGDRFAAGARVTTDHETNDLSELANTSPVTMRVVRPGSGQETARPKAPPRAPQPGPAQLTSDDAELRRIREILVGPYLRDHERRLRAIERQSAAGQGEPAQTQGDAVAQLAAELERERADRQALARELRMVGDGRQTMRAELARERQTREEVADRHALAISELAKTLDHERAAHARMHALHAAELDVRLEHERQAHAEAIETRLRRERMAQAEALDAQLEQERLAHAEELRRLRDAHEAQIGALRQLVADAEGALVAMQAERQYLAGLLAELGLHLVHHAASPAAVEAERATVALQGSSRKDRVLGN